MIPFGKRIEPFVDRFLLDSLTGVRFAGNKPENRGKVIGFDTVWEGATFIIDAPLLFESGLDKICDITLAVLAPAQKRIERIVQRDAISRELAEKRISAQLPEEELMRLATEFIVNDKTVEDLEKAITDFALRRGIIQ